MPGPGAIDKPFAPTSRRGVYPGSFNPPTVGHVAIAEAAISQRQLTELHIVVSHVPLAKSNPVGPTLADRIEVITGSFSHLRQVVVATTEAQLISDIAHGFDTVVMGLDKWHQINDPSFYDDGAHMAEALARLPELAIAGRNGAPAPSHAVLEVSAATGIVSSTGARGTRPEWMTAAAAASGHW